jgi:hypothetical protein
MLDSVCTEKVEGNPLNYWQGYRNSQISSMAAEDIKNLSHQRTFTDGLEPIVSAQFLNNCAGTAPTPVARAVVPAKAANFAAKKTSTYAPKHHAVLARYNAASSKWWKTYLSQIKSVLPKSIKIDCVCNGKDCVSCFALKVLADANNIAFLANGVTGYRCLRTQGELVGAASRVRYNGNAVSNLPISSHTFNKRDWQCVPSAKDTETSETITCMLLFLMCTFRKFARLPACPYRRSAARISNCRSSRSLVARLPAEQASF